MQFVKNQQVRCMDFSGCSGTLLRESGQEIFTILDILEGSGALIAIEGIRGAHRAKRFQPLYQCTDTEYEEVLKGQEAYDEIRAKI